jgi:hypothetical protein
MKEITSLSLLSFHKGLNWLYFYLGTFTLPLLSILLFLHECNLKALLLYLITDYPLLHFQVIKVTAGKFRLRNEEEKSFNDGNSAWIEKNDIVICNGNMYAENFDKDQHVACRVRYLV